MNNIEDHIDDLFKNKLGLATAPHSDKLWDALLKKYRIIKFFKFSFSSFNISYVITGIAISTGVLCYVNHEKVSMQNTTPKPSTKQVIINNHVEQIEQNIKTELTEKNIDQQSSKQNVVRGNSKPVLLNKQNSVSIKKNTTDTTSIQFRNDQTSSVSNIPEQMRKISSMQMQNDTSKKQPKEQNFRKNNTKVDSVIKYDTTVTSKKKVKFRWNKNK